MFEREAYKRMVYTSQGEWTVKTTIQQRAVIRDEDGNILRDKDFVSDKWEQYFFTSLTTISATINRAIIKNITQRSIALSQGDPPGRSEADKALRATPNGKATGMDSLPAQILKFVRNGEASEVLYHCHSMVAEVWTSGEVPQ